MEQHFIHMYDTKLHTYAWKKALHKCREQKFIQMYENATSYYC